MESDRAFLASLAHVPGLDPAEGLRCCGMDHRLFERALLNFVTLYEDGLPKILLPSASTHDVLGEVHSFSGAAAVIGAVKLAVWRGS